MLPNQLMTPGETVAYQMLCDMFRNMVVPEHDQYTEHAAKVKNGQCGICRVKKALKL